MFILFSAVRHLKKYVILFAAFTTNIKSELHLLNKIQEYCYDNMNFIKSFNKIVLLLYKSKFRFILLISCRKCLKVENFKDIATIVFLFVADVLSEDAILKWYKETHSSRGWSVFMDQMKKFVDWLEQAEEEGKYWLEQFKRCFWTIQNIASF